MPSYIAPANPCHDVIQRRFLSPEVCLPLPIDPNSHRVSVEVRGEGCIEVMRGQFLACQHFVCRRSPPALSTNKYGKRTERTVNFMAKRRPDETALNTVPPNAFGVRGSRLKTLFFAPVVQNFLKALPGSVLQQLARKLQL